jgi:tetratricopeptide (TPR) repeat protein
LDALTEIVERLINLEHDLTIKPPDPCPADIIEVYTALEELRVVILFTSDAVAKQGGTRALLAYSAACELFEVRGNVKGRAVSLYLISRLEFQAGRYIESVKSMKDCLQLGRRLEESAQGQGKTYYREWIRRRTQQLIKVLLVIAEEQTAEVIEDAIFYVNSVMNSPTTTDSELALSNLQLSLACVLQDKLEEAGEHRDKARRLMEKLECSGYLLDFKGYVDGLLLQAKGKLRAAAECFTSVLERSAELNPRTKAGCVKHLCRIFESKGLYNPQLLALHQGVSRRKDVVFLMDYSLSMVGPRISRVLKGFLYLFDRALSAQDRVSFVVFNRFPEVIFDLTCKGYNTRFLRRAIEASK